MYIHIYINIFITMLRTKRACSRQMVTSVSVCVCVCERARGLDRTVCRHGHCDMESSPRYSYVYSYIYISIFITMLRTGRWLQLPRAGGRPLPVPRAAARFSARASQQLTPSGHMRMRGYRIVINDGAEAQQSVYHLHMHLLSGYTYT